MNDESAPKGAPETGSRSAPKSTAPRPVLLAHDERQAAYEAGYAAGMLAKVDLLAETRAHEILHEDATAALGLARREAAKVGPAWASLIEDQVSA